jgi:hypothetical protein
LPSFVFEGSARLYEHRRGNAKLVRNGNEIWLVRFEKSDETGKQRGLSRAAAKLVCPDSGQVEEAPGPPVMPERCRKRGQRESVGINVTFVCHGVERSARVKERHWRRFSSSKTMR